MSGYVPMLRLLTDGTLFGRWPDTGIWPVLLSIADDAKEIDIIPRAISDRCGLPETELLACIDRFIALGWLEKIYVTDRWGWRITDKAEVRPPAPRRLGQTEWSVVRLEIFERDNYTCQYCGDRSGPFECDHVMPVCRGGSSDPGNLVTACRTCNRSKKDRTPEEWACRLQ